MKNSRPDSTVRRFARSLLMGSSFVALGLCAQTTQALTLEYTYTGNNFTSFNGTGFTNDDRVSASLIIDCSKTGTGDCSNYQNSSITMNDISAYSFSAGPIVFSETDDDWFVGLLRLNTDGLGEISTWWIDFSGPPMICDSSSCILSYLQTANSLDPGGQYNPDFQSDIADYVGFGGAFNEDMPGNWTMKIVPIPAALYLFGSGLFGLIGIARRKKA